MEWFDLVSEVAYLPLKLQSMRLELEYTQYLQEKIKRKDYLEIMHHAKIQYDELCNFHPSPQNHNFTVHNLDFALPYTTNILEKSKKCLQGLITSLENGVFDERCFAYWRLIQLYKNGGWQEIGMFYPYQQGIYLHEKVYAYLDRRTGGLLKTYIYTNHLIFDFGREIHDVTLYHYDEMEYFHKMSKEAIHRILDAYPVVIDGDAEAEAHASYFKRMLEAGATGEYIIFLRYSI